MRCKKVQRGLSDYLSGRFTGRKKAAIAAHLSECDKCAEQLRLLESMRKLLQATPPEEPDETYWENFLPRLKDRILKAAAPRGDYANRKRLIGLFKRQKPKLLWASVVVAVFGLILIVLTALNTEVRFEKNVLSVKIAFGSRGIPDVLSQEQKQMIQAEFASLLQDYEERRKAEMALYLKAIQAQREADLTLMNEKMEAIIRRTGEGFNNMSAALNFLTVERR